MDFVDFNLAKKLKEKGFPQHWSDQHYILENEYEDDFFEVGAKYPVEVIYDYIPTIAAPTISQVLKWLRDEKKIFISIGLSMCGYHYDVQYNIKNNSDYPDLLKWDNAILNGEQTVFASYEAAAIAGIEYVIDNLI
jgi:hypothetical protein